MYYFVIVHMSIYVIYLLTANTKTEEFYVKTKYPKYLGNAEELPFKPVQAYFKPVGTC